MGVGLGFSIHSPNNPRSEHMFYQNNVCRSHEKNKDLNESTRTGLTIALRIFSRGLVHQIRLKENCVNDTKGDVKVVNALCVL